MVSFDYLINDAMGLHARPVGLVVKAVKPYKESEITIEHDGQTADAKRMFAVMALQVKQGEKPSRAARSRRSPTLSLISSKRRSSEP